jgi:hypothetical protein
MEIARKSQSDLVCPCYWIKRVISLATRWKAL